METYGVIAGEGQLTCPSNNLTHTYFIGSTRVAYPYVLISVIGTDANRNFSHRRTIASWVGLLRWKGSIKNIHPGEKNNENTSKWHIKYELHVSRTQKH